MHNNKRMKKNLRTFIAKDKIFNSITQTTNMHNNKRIKNLGTTIAKDKNF